MPDAASGTGHTVVKATPRTSPTWVTPPRGFAEKGWAQRRSAEVGHVHGTIKEQEKLVMQEVGGAGQPGEGPLGCREGRTQENRPEMGAGNSRGYRQIGASGGITGVPSCLFLFLNELSQGQCQWKETGEDGVRLQGEEAEVHRFERQGDTWCAGRAGCPFGICGQNSKESHSTMPHGTIPPGTPSWSTKTRLAVGQGQGVGE